MAETHQTETPTTVAPPETTVVPPRSQDPTPPEPRDPDEKAAREAKERMSKTQGFWNRLAPAKEETAPKPAEATPEPAPKKEEKPAATERAKAEDEEPEPKSDKKPKGKKKEPETKPEIDPIELARVTGQEIGREMAKSQAANVPRGTKSEDVNVEVELPPEFQPDVAVFEEMARLDPKRYGNIKKELGRYAQQESEYIEKWEKEHEGETYDGDAEEHNAFYAKIQPKYDQKDFKNAEKSLLKKEVRNEVTQELRQHEVEAERRREKSAQIQPEVDRDMVGILGDMIRETDPDNAELAKDWASIQTLDEKNPLLSDVMVVVHNETKPVVMATMRLFRGVEAPDQSNPIHVRLFDVIAKAEQRISSLPMKERYDDDGRLFATQEDYAKMSQADKARHWYVGEREALALIRGQAIARTKSIYEQETKKLARYAKLPNTVQPTQPTSSKRAETPQPPKPDNGSPTVGGRGTLPGDGQSVASKPTNGRDLFFGRHLGS